MNETLSNPKVLDLSNPVLNEDWLRQRFAQVNWCNGSTTAVTLAGVKIDHVWQTKKRRMILYQLYFDQQYQRPGATYVGYQVDPDRFDKELKQVQKSVRRQPMVGPAVLVWPEVNTVLLAFPNDRKMELLDEEAVGTWLQRRIRSGKWIGRLNPESHSVHLEPLRYVPGKRFPCCAGPWLPVKGVIARRCALSSSN